MKVTLNTLPINPETRLPYPANVRVDVPEKVKSLKALLAIVPSWVNTSEKEANRAGLGLVMACDGYQTELRGVMAKLDGSVIYGRVQNDVNAEIGDAEVTAAERRAIEARVANSLTGDDRENFRAIVDSEQNKLASFIERWAGDVVFFDNTFKYLKRMRGVDFSDIRSVWETTKTFKDAYDQVGELRELRTHCITEATTLEGRLAEWDSIISEL